MDRYISGRLSGRVNWFVCLSLLAGIGAFSGAAAFGEKALPPQPADPNVLQKADTNVNVPIVAVAPATTPVTKPVPPYKVPDAPVVDITKGLPGKVMMTGPIAVNVGGGTMSPSFMAGEEGSEGQWAQFTLQGILGDSIPQGDMKALADSNIEGSGAALSNETFLSPLQTTLVKGYAMVLEIPVTFIETQNEVTGLTYNCSAQQCVPGFESDGDTGVFSGRPEICLSSPNSTKLAQVKDVNKNAIKCTTVNGVQGKNGYWYDLLSGNAWANEVKVNGAPAPGSYNPESKTYTGTLKIPINLPVPESSIRVEIKMGLKDQGKLGPGNYVKTDWGLVNGTNSSGQATESSTGGPENLLTRFAIQLPKVSVLPAAFVTMKALPYTIVYRPPGDKSTGTYATTNSFGTTMTTGVGTSIDNTTSFMESQSVTTNESVTALIATISAQQTASSSQTMGNDINGTVGTGLVTANSHASTRSWTLGSASADPTILPASGYVTPSTCTASNWTASACALQPAETYYSEPFWEDRIVLLLNPTAELWNFNAGTTMQMLGAKDYDAVSIRDLYNCYVAGVSQEVKLTNGESLSPAECNDLLQLDPYYVEGQATDPSQTNRGVPLGGNNYGGDAQNPTAAGVTVGFSDVFTTSTTQTTNGSSSYMASVSSMVGFSWSEGLSATAKESAYGLDIGLSAGISVAQGYQNTTGNQMKVTYSNSTAAASSNVTTITGSFNDDHDFDTQACQAAQKNCYSPVVNVYLDELFGGYMFSDPNAPKKPGLIIFHPSPTTPVRMNAVGK
jgi:hypothetical protein